MAQKISPCLWFDRQAEQAARFYTSLLPDSRIDHVQRSSVDWPNGKAGDVILVEFTLAGSSYQGLNGGPNEHPSNAVSFSVRCRDQEEVDRLWGALSADGGQPVMCGWLKDRWGFAWQIVPEAMIEMMRDPDPARTRRVMQAMMQMVKLDIAGLRRAFDGS